MSDLFTQLDELAEQAEAEIADLESDKATIDERIRRLKTLVRAAKPQAAGSGRPKQQPSSYRRPHAVTRQTIRVAEGLLDWFSQNPGEAATVQDIMAHLHMHQPDVNRQMKTLRDREFLRLAGEAPGPTGKMRTNYRLLDREVLGKLKEEIDAR